MSQQSPAPAETPFEVPESLPECQDLARELKRKLDEAKERIAFFERQLFGPRADRPAGPAPGEADLFARAGSPPQPPGKKKGSAERRRGKPHGRRNLACAEHLPIVGETVHDVPASEKVCDCGCGRTKRPLPPDISWLIEWIPGHLGRTRVVTLKYACDCPACVHSPIVAAERPMEALPRAMAAPSLLVHIAVSKFADHLPLHRLQSIFARKGVDIHRSAMCDWLTSLAALLAVLVELMRKRQCAGNVLGMDETKIAVQAKGKTQTGWMWTMTGGDDAPYTTFHFLPTRGRAGPDTLLEGFRGTLLTDAYDVYESYCKGRPIVWAGCWAHVRRKFVDAHKAAPDARALEIIQRIGELYEIERRCAERGLSREQRLAMRQDISSHLFESLFERLDALVIEVLPKSVFGKAVAHALANRKRLDVHLADPAIPIDNNATERAIRPIAVGRKNWLFAGNRRGAQTAAVFFTLIASARRHGINPEEYLLDLIVRLPSHPRTRIEEFLPDRWKAIRDAQSPPATQAAA